MRGEKGDLLTEEYRKIQSAMSDSNPKVREEAYEDNKKFLEDHPERQSELVKK